MIEKREKIDERESEEIREDRYDKMCIRERRISKR